MTTVEVLSNLYDYDPERFDRQTWWNHHRALIAALEPAKWPLSRYSEPLFNEAEIIDIRMSYASGYYTLAELGDLFETALSNIGHIVSGRRYANCGGPITHRGAGNRPPNRSVA